MEDEDAGVEQEYVDYEGRYHRWIGAVGLSGAVVTRDIIIARIDGQLAELEDSVVEFAVKVVSSHIHSLPVLLVRRRHK